MLVLTVPANKSVILIDRESGEQLGKITILPGNRHNVGFELKPSIKILRENLVHKKE